MKTSIPGIDLDPLAENLAYRLRDASIKHMYHHVYGLQKAGKLSSAGTKGLVKDLLTDIYAGSLVVDEDGKLYRISMQKLAAVQKELKEL